MTPNPASECPSVGASNSFEDGDPIPRPIPLMPKLLPWPTKTDPGTNSRKTPQCPPGFSSSEHPQGSRGCCSMCVSHKWGWVGSHSMPPAQRPDIPGPGPPVAFLFVAGRLPRQQGSSSLFHSSPYEDAVLPRTDDSSRHELFQTTKIRSVSSPGRRLLYGSPSRRCLDVKEAIQLTIISSWKRAQQSTATRCRPARLPRVILGIPLQLMAP